MTQSNAVALPRDVRPVRYDLALTPDLEAFTFEGQVSIDVEILEPTSRIVLNCAEIDVKSCSLSTADGGEREAGGIEYDEGEETVAFDFGGELAPGAARLDIAFTGELNDRLRGFYRSSYAGADGRERVMATTQFESTDARRAFPCWDEPSLEGHVRGHADDSRRTGGGVQHAHRERGGRGRREDGAVRGVADHVHVPAGVRRRRPEVRGASRGQRHADPGVGYER